VGFKITILVSEPQRQSNGKNCHVKQTAIHSNGKIFYSAQYGCSAFWGSSGMVDETFIGYFDYLE